MAVSFIPILGTAASAVIDAGNAALYLSRGRLKDAAWSAAGVLPFVTELRAGSRLGRALAHGAAEAATRVGRRAAKYGDDVVAIVRKAPHLACPTNSFAAGTQVVVGVAADGSLVTKSIEDVRVGDHVLTRPSDDPSAEATLEPVLGVSHRTVYELYQIEILGPDGGTEVLQTTAGHPFYVEGIGWVDAQDLKAGDHLDLHDGGEATILGVTTLAVPEGVEVYNLTVADGRTYFVADGQGDVHAAAWVHNCSTKKSLGLLDIGRYGDNAASGLEKHEVINAKWL